MRSAWQADGQTAGQRAGIGDLAKPDTIKEAVKSDADV